MFTGVLFPAAFEDAACAACVAVDDLEFGFWSSISTGGPFAGRRFSALYHIMITGIKQTAEIEFTADSL